MAKKNDFSYAANDNGSIELGNQVFTEQAFEQSTDYSNEELSKLLDIHNITKTSVSNEVDNAEALAEAQRKTDEAINDIIGGSVNSAPINVPISNLIPCRPEWNDFSKFPHDRKIELVESIIKFGIFHNIVIRATDESNSKFEVLSGNNRVQGLRDAYAITQDVRYATAPAKIYMHGEISDEDAHAIVVMTNYIDRKEMASKDKLSSIIFLYEYHKKQKEADKTKVKNIAQYLSEKTDTNLRTFYNYIGLRKLIPSFFEMLSNKHINLGIANKLCKLSSEYQEVLHTNFKNDIYMLSKACSIYSKCKGNITPADLVYKTSCEETATTKQLKELELRNRTYSITAARPRDKKETGFLLFVPEKDAEMVRTLISRYIVSVMDN